MKSFFAKLARSGRKGLNSAPALVLGLFQGVWLKVQKVRKPPVDPVIEPGLRVDEQSALPQEFAQAYQPSQELWQQKHYALMADPDEVDQAFNRLRNYCYEQFLAARKDDSSYGLPAKPSLFWEAGRIAPGRPYFFLQQNNQTGWLFERSGLGWLVSRSEKNVAQSLFLRQGEPIDSVVLYKNLEQPWRFRVSSQRNPESLVSYLVYERCAFAEVLPATGRYR